MSTSKKKFILSNEIFINEKGQIVFRKRFLSKYITRFYKFLTKNV